MAVNAELVPHDRNIGRLFDDRQQRGPGREHFVHGRPDSRPRKGVAAISRGVESAPSGRHPRWAARQSLFDPGGIAAAFA